MLKNNYLCYLDVLLNICRIYLRNEDKAELERRIRRGIQIKTNQAIKGNWNEIDKSAFCKDYKIFK